MRRTRFDRWPCSIARTADLTGDWWTPLVLREAFYGVRRFDDFQTQLGISRNVLTQRLNRLVAAGMLEREPYQERPLRHEYALTQKGLAFWPVLATMMCWGNDWLVGPKGPPVELHDVETGRVVHPVLADRETGEIIDWSRVRPRLGPGFPKSLARKPEVRARFGLDADN